MKQTERDSRGSLNLRYCLIGLGAIIIGWYLISFYLTPPAEEKIIKIEQKIDSIREVERILYLRDTILKREIKEIEVVKEKALDSIYNLPLDSGLLYLKDKLEQDEEN